MAGSRPRVVVDEETLVEVLAWWQERQARERRDNSVTFGGAWRLESNDAGDAVVVHADTGTTTVIASNPA